MQSIGFLSITADDLRGIVATAVEDALTRQQPTPSVPAPAEDRLLTRKETARKLHLSFVTLRELEKRGKLIPVRATRRVLYRESEIERYLNGSKGAARR